MIACLVGQSPRLFELAEQFSPVVEKISSGEVAFSIDGLGSLFGDAHQIAGEIARRGAQMEILASLAIASNKSTALIAARYFRGVRVIELGRETKALAEIPIEALPLTLELFQTLSRWGIATLGNLAALPETGIAERLGAAGINLRRLARGEGGDILAPFITPPAYGLRRDLDEPIELLESLLFLISAQLHDLTEQLRKNGRAARGVVLTLALECGEDFIREIELPVATCDPLALLKQLQLSLDANPPGAGIVAVQTSLTPADIRVVQGGLFRPPTPQPDKLQTLLARLTALAGTDRVGSPEILNTHRPDAFRIRTCAFEATDPADPKRSPLRIAFRHFRPPLVAKVIVKSQAPVRVTSERVSGQVIQFAGPWRTSGGMWAASSWERDEWDIVLEDQAIYRLYLTSAMQWYLCGSYD